MQLPLPHSSWLCVPHVNITPFVIASRGTGVSPGGIQGASLSISSLSLFLFLSPLKGTRTLFVASSVAPRASLFKIYIHIYLSLFLFVSFISSTLVDEILWHLATCPSSGFVARRRGRPHVMSGYSCVKSGTRFGRAPSHSHSPRTRVHAPFIIGTASKRMPKAANFAPFILYVVYCKSTNACAVMSSTNFTFSNYRERLINIFQWRPK